MALNDIKAARIRELEEMLAPREGGGCELGGQIRMLFKVAVFNRIQREAALEIRRNKKKKYIYEVNICGGYI